MWKWTAVGFLAGAVVTAALFRVVDARRAEADRAVAAASLENEKSAAAARVAEAQEATARAGAENAKLKTAVRSLEEKLAALPPAPPASGQPAAAPRRRTLKELAGALAGLGDKLKGRTWETWPKEAKELQAELQAAIAALAAELGISPDEAMRSPEGMSLLLVELLAQSVPPLTAAQEAQLREMLAKQDKSFDAWLEARKDLSALESRKMFLEVAGASRDEFFAALTPDQRAAVAGYGFFESQLQGSQTWVDGSRAKVTQELLTQWSSTLSLDERQTQILAPIVTDYINQARDLNDAIWARRAAGEELSREKDYAMRLELMIATQKKIAEATQLTDEQAKAMKDWGFTYGANVTDEMGEEKKN